MGRRGLSETRAADLLGVPVFTLRKWTAGQRAPNAAAVRLLEVLGMLDALAPALLGALEPAAAAPEPVAHVEKVPVKPKRSRKGSPG
jgi:hypothetical protein